MVGEILCILIFLSGGVMSVRTRLVQRKLNFSAVLEKKGEGEISAFGALCTTLAATLGTGNIVGVAGAVMLGGPGALLWMLVSAFFGMALKYAECFLGAKTRRRGEGGPYVYIENRFGKGLARLYALCGAAAGALTMGTTSQTDSMIGVLDPARGRASFLICAAVAVLAGWVLWGGAKGISSFCEKIIPVMSAAYILCCAAILWRFRAELPAALWSILKGAFCPAAVLGGTAGSLIRTLSVGVSRGVFSNEAGLGSAAIAAAASGGSPHSQGLVAMSGVFLDTVVMCTLTGLCVVVTGAEGSGSAVAGETFRLGLGNQSVGLLSAFLILFAFTTVVGWYFFGSACFRYLTGGRWEKGYRLFYIGMLLVTPLVQSDRLWMLADILNLTMALPNLTALLFTKNCIDLDDKL